MVLQKPLSYPCHEPILLNMAADPRIRFALHCPAIQKSDKRVPLKIDCLVWNPLELQMDGSIYEIDFLRRSHVSRTSQRLSNQFDRMRFPPNDYTNGDIEGTRDRKQSLISLLETAIRTKLGMVRRLDHTDYLECSLWNGKFQKEERLEYTRSAFSTMDYLLEKIFGEREFIYVDFMGIGTPELSSEKLREKISGLKIPPLFQLLKQFNFKVKHVLSKGEHIQVDSSISQKVETLHVSGNMDSLDMEKLDFQRVQFMDNAHQFLNWIVKQLEEKPLKIGTFWACNLENKDHGEVINFFENFSAPDVVVNGGIRIIKNDNTRGTRFPDRVVFQPADGTSEMHVFCRRTQTRNWTMIMRVFPIIN